MKDFSEKQILNQLVKMSVYILTSNASSSIKLDIIVYLMNNLHTDILLNTDILIRKEANIDLKRKKFTIEYKKIDLVFKTLNNFTDMYITTHSTMHEILHQRRLNYITFTHQF